MTEVASLSSKNDQSAESKTARGRLMAQLLAGAWRASELPPGTSDEEFSEIAPLLLRSGAGALVWWRIRDSSLGATSSAEQFQHDYRFHALQAALHERALKRIIKLLRGCGVEPVLVKGWSVARHYPETGLRQYSDFDLCVLPAHFEAAKTALKSIENDGHNVDLHQGFGKFFDTRTDDVFGRSQLVSFGELEVRVLSEEDHLRFLCLHWLRHGAVRPLWLCDIAVMLEKRSSDFDWERCLGSSRQQANWVTCAVGLAHELLGAQIEETPIAGRKLPRWLVPAVLKEWGTQFRPMSPLALYLRQPLRRLKELSGELSHHWPNPIEATMTLNGPFNELPRLPFQVGHVFSRTAALVAQLARGSGPVDLRS